MSGLYVWLISKLTRQDCWVGRVSASYSSGPEIYPQVRHILLWRFFFPFSADSRRDSPQLLVKEWALNTG